MWLCCFLLAQQHIYLTLETLPVQSRRLPKPLHTPRPKLDPKPAMMMRGAREPVQNILKKITLKCSPFWFVPFCVHANLKHIFVLGHFTQMSCLDSRPNAQSCVQLLVGFRWTELHTQCLLCSCQVHIESLSEKLESVLDQQSASTPEAAEQEWLRTREIEARIRAEVEAELEQKFIAAAATEREQLIVQQREIVAAISDRSLQLKRDYEQKLQQVLDEASAEKRQLQEKLTELMENEVRNEKSAAEHETALAAAQEQHELAVQQLIEQAQRELEEAHSSAAEAQQQLADQHGQALWDVEAELARHRDNLLEAEKQFDMAQTTHRSVLQQQAQEFAQRMQRAEEAFQDELELQLAAKEISADASLEVHAVTLPIAANYHGAHTCTTHAHTRRRNGCACTMIPKRRLWRWVCRHVVQK